jgi:heme/flavin dehydrogenase (mycofactocin system)
MTRVPFNNIAEAERLAKKKLPRAVWLAVKAGNEQGWTLDENVRAYNDLGFTPTVFDRPTIGKLDTKTRVLGVDIDFPVIVSPVGAQAIHPGGELAAARAASRMGTAIGLSSYASNSIREVAAANDKTFFQLYWVGTRDRMEARVEEARLSGAKALIVTLDWSFTPRRDWGVPPAPPMKLDLRTMMALAPDALSRPAWLARYLVKGRIPELKVPNLFITKERVPTFGEAWQEFENTPTPTWDDVKWLRDLWGGPFMIKGISSIRDARLAVEMGVNAISVSNHGGNNIDGTPAPIRFLPSIVDAVGEDIDVLVDGGIRRGSDVVKALALGAKAVFVGRAYVYGLAVSGEDGVYKVLEILRNGIEETLFGIGKSSVADLSPEDLVILNRDFLVTPTS